MFFFQPKCTSRAGLEPGFFFRTLLSWRCVQVYRDPKPVASRPATGLCGVHRLRQTPVPEPVTKRIVGGGG